MRLDELRDHCLAKPATSEDQPFGPDVLVFRVAGKMFALARLDGPPFSVNLKCEPERALLLRERYAGVAPGYHMDKRHWNTVALAEDVPGDELRALVDHSYDLVVATLPKRERERIEGS